MCFLSLVLAILLVFNVNRLHATLAVNCAESINAFVCKYDTSVRIMLKIVVAIVIMTPNASKLLVFIMLQL